MGLRPGWQNKLISRLKRRMALRSLMDTDWHENMSEENAYDDDCGQKCDTLSSNKNSYFEYSVGNMSISDDSSVSSDDVTEPSKTVCGKVSTKAVSYAQVVKTGVVRTDTPNTNDTKKIGSSS